MQRSCLSRTSWHWPGAPRFRSGCYTGVQAVAVMECNGRGIGCGVADRSDGLVPHDQARVFAHICVRVAAMLILKATFSSLRGPRLMADVGSRSPIVLAPRARLPVYWHETHMSGPSGPAARG